MHQNALNHAKLFFEVYCKNQNNLKVVEIGSYDVNGSLRDVVPKNITTYTGIDFSPGPGVDIVLNDPYQFPFENDTFDVLVTSSCFEHSELFWLTYLECLRILKPDGIMYCNIPSSSMCYHQFPVDCWRFYPDAPKALEVWAKRNGYNTSVLECYIANKSHPAECFDSVSIYLKDKNYENLYQERIVDGLIPYTHFFNAYRFPKNKLFPNGWNFPHFPYEQKN